MKHLNRILLVCIACLSIFNFSNAYAYCLVGNKPGAITLSLVGGEEYFSSKRQLQNTGIGMGILGFNFSHEWAFEALVGFMSTNFDNSVGDKREVNGTLFALDGVYRFMPFQFFRTEKVLEPFVLAGVGITGLNPNRNDANNEGNVNFGIGAQMFFDPVVALRAELRDFYTIVGGKNDVIIDGGISILFDLC